VYSLAKILRLHHISIRDLDTDTSSAPFAGYQIFTLKTIVAIPLQVDWQVLNSEMTEYENQFGVQVAVTDPTVIDNSEPSARALARSSNKDGQEQENDERGQDQDRRSSGRGRRSSKEDESESDVDEDRSGRKSSKSRGEEDDLEDMDDEKMARMLKGLSTEEIKQMLSEAKSNLSPDTVKNEIDTLVGEFDKKNAKQRGAGEAAGAARKVKSSVTPSSSNMKQIDINSIADLERHSKDPNSPLRGARIEKIPTQK